MKRMCMAALVALVIAGTASAQGAAPPNQAAAQPQQISISGKLELIDGVIGLKSGGTSYYTPQLWRLVGFVKDLQEGAQVTLTGYAFPVPEGSGKVFFAATKLSLGGKDYDLGQRGGPFGRMRMRGPGRDGMRGEMMEGPCW
jgi:hypothetical protein